MPRCLMMSFNSKTTEKESPKRNTWVPPALKWGSRCSIFSVVSSVLFVFLLLGNFVACPSSISDYASLWHLQTLLTLKAESHGTGQPSFCTVLQFFWCRIDGVSIVSKRQLWQCSISVCIGTFAIFDFFSKPFYVMFKIYQFEILCLLMANW